MSFSKPNFNSVPGDRNHGRFLMLFFSLHVFSVSDENNIYGLRFLIKPVLSHFHVCDVSLQHYYYAFLTDLQSLVPARSG